MAALANRVAADGACAPPLNARSLAGPDPVIRWRHDKALLLL